MGVYDATRFNSIYSTTYPKGSYDRSRWLRIYKDTHSCTYLVLRNQSKLLLQLPLVARPARLVRTL